MTLPTTAESSHAGVGEESGKAVRINVFAPKVHLVGAKEDDWTKFGLSAVPIVVKPGVKVDAKTVSTHFAPASYSPPATARSLAPRKPSRWR